MPVPAPEPGDHVGPYRIVRLLGSGGMGVVHEAVDTTLGRRVALKLIAGELAADPGFRGRFVGEAQAQASLDSPHVVQVFAHGEVGGRLYIASQLMPDGDLGALLRRGGPLPVEVAVDLVAQIADGLAEAHRVGLVHRDIKPANVLLRNRGTALVACLADFGIAAPAGAGESFAGTPGYAAPEVLAGGRATPASDVYSLGCLLGAVLPGRPGGELARVLDRALAADPADRQPTAAAVRDELRSLRRTTPSRTRVRLLVASGAAAAVVAAAIVGATLLISQGGDRSAHATAGIADALVAGGEVDRETADCAARSLVDDHGLRELPPPDRQDSALRDLVLAATARCLWSGQPSASRTRPTSVAT